MSYLDLLFNHHLSRDIDEFLQSEKFVWDLGPNGQNPKFERCFSGNGSKNYTVWVEVYDITIYCNAEYNAGGGTANDEHFPYTKGDFDSFLSAFEKAVDFMKTFLI